MKYRYTKFTGDELDDLDLEDLVSKLSDLLLSSGFGNPYGMDDEERTMQALHDAILDALFNGGVLPEETIERLLGDPADGDQADARSKLEELIQQIIERMAEQGYITDAARSRGRARAAAGTRRPAGRTSRAGHVRGHRQDARLPRLPRAARSARLARQEQLRPPRHARAGDRRRNDRRAEAVRVRRHAEPRRGGTLLNAAQRAARATARAPSRGINVTHEDLMVVQGEYQSSCATVLMLDCSHSMILYGEDRFTPAKRVALALAQLIKTQYPGDALKVVLFHDSAEEIPLAELGRVRVGPYYTNTREGLRLARRILDRQRKDMRQIIMITDGKPSALTQPDGRIYKNAFGLDPFIVAETCAEVAACRKSGIMINTFMLARDYDLVSFVRRVAEICKGKAYFTTPYTLGQYVLMDYMDKKTKTIH